MVMCVKKEPGCIADRAQRKHEGARLRIHANTTPSETQEKMIEVTSCREPNHAHRRVKILYILFKRTARPASPQTMLAQHSVSPPGAHLGESSRSHQESPPMLSPLAPSMAPMRASIPATRRLLDSRMYG